MGWVLILAAGVAVAVAAYALRVNLRARRDLRSLQNRPWWGQR